MPRCLATAIFGFFAVACESALSHAFCCYRHPSLGTTPHNRHPTSTPHSHFASENSCYPGGRREVQLMLSGEALAAGLGEWQRTRLTFCKQQHGPPRPTECCCTAVQRVSYRRATYCCRCYRYCCRCTATAPLHDTAWRAKIVLPKKERIQRKYQTLNKL